MGKVKGVRKLGRLFQLFRAAPKLFRSDKVPAREKALFGGLIVLYWLMPDIMPFIPIDDIVFTAVLIPWFSRRARRYDPSILK